MARRGFLAALERYAVTIRFSILVALIIACVLLGGASRVSTPGLIFLQPFAVCCAVATLLLPGTIDLSRVNWPLYLLCALAGVMLFQLVPLPPEWWATPARAQFTVAADGVGAVWRPISLTPDLTLASLASLTVPLAVLICAGALPREKTHDLLPYLIFISGLSAILGMLQVAGPPNGPLYRYQATNMDTAVGFFANRNHQALLLASTLPMLAAWLLVPTKFSGFRWARVALAAALAIFLIPMVLVTGSRAGMVFAVLGALFAAYLLAAGRLRARARAPWVLWGAVGFSVAIVAVTTAAIVFSRALALDRFWARDVLADQRATFFPYLTRIANDFLPFGSGFGSFDPVFRFYEPMSILKQTYFNHAHNEALELLITGGIPAVLVAVAFLGWLTLKLVRVFGHPVTSSLGLFGRLAGVFCLFTLLSSLVDYPLRTPWLAGMFALACVWLAEAGAARRTGP